MRKIIMIFFALMFLFSAKDVFAQDQYQLTLEKQDGIFMSRRGVNYDDDSYPYYIYKMNGMFAYCIEPGKHISTYTYVGEEDYIDLPFSEEVKEKLELIGYYGRDYPGHNNVRYSMATQALIWELTGVDTVTFWTGLNETGEEIDISKERNEIINLVNNHKTLPDFNNKYTAHLKHELVISDANKVLSNFEIVSNDIGNIYIDNNTLHIIPDKVGIYNISLKRKSYDEYNTIIFVGKGDNSSQKLGRLHFNKEISKDITVNVKGIRLLFHKVDENNKTIRVSNIKFKIKNKKTGEYVCSGISDCIHITDSSGSFLTEPLDYGEYEIEELENQMIPGYIWNSEKLDIKIDNNTSFRWNSSTQYNYLDVYFTNKSIPITVKINKKGEVVIYNDNNITYQEEKLGNVSFDVYSSSNKYIETVTTNQDGVAVINDLKIGKYYLIEKNTLNKYIEKDKIPFTISQTSQYQTSINYNINVKNELKKGKLEFSKVDSKTNKGIANTIIEIYDENNKLLLTKETDSNGKIEVDNLPIGKYYIKEKEANYYYAKTTDKQYFEINNNDEVVKIKMTNDKILGKVEIEKLGEVLQIKNNQVNYEMISLPNIEFYLYNENDELIKTLKTNSNGKVSYELELGKYYILEKTKLLEYRDNNKKYNFEIKKDGNKAINVLLTIENYLKKGNIEFTKKELLTHAGITNTIMELYDSNNNLLLTKETDVNGIISIRDLPLGNYYFKEKAANYYFQITDELVPLELKEDKEMVNVSLVNKKIVGNLEINKKGENYHFINNDINYEKIALHAIEFILYDEKDNLIGNIKTDNNGYAKYSNLPLGKYYLIEKTGLDRFVKGDKYYFEIKKKDFNSAIDVKLDIVNYLKKGNLEFSKIDIATSEGIPNTIIEIYNDNNDLLLTRETDKNGKVVINNLPTGKYYIVEKQANYNYQKTDEKVLFEIKENGEIVKAKMSNKRITGSLEIEKYGESYQITNNELIYEKNKLANIKFDLYDINDNYIVSLNTNKDGYAKYSDLSLGKYYLIEVSHLDGYVKNNDKIYFEIVKKDDFGVDVKLTISNFLKKGNLEFTKEDFTTSAGIPNTIIEIYSEDNSLLFTKETDDNGKVVINNLPTGKYFIIEKEANSSYMLTNEKVLFEIKDDGEIVKAKMTNEKIEIPVLKTDTKEEIIVNSILGFLFLVGIGRLYYEKKSY